MGRMASRVLAVLIALHALTLLPGLIGNLTVRGTLVVVPLVAGLAVEEVLLVALALHCWYRATSVGALLLPPRGRVPAGLEVTVIRAVGLYVGITALAGAANWVMVVATRLPGQQQVPAAIAPFLVPALLELALGLVVTWQAPALSRVFTRRGP